MLQIENLSFAYQEDKIIIDKLKLFVGKGEMVVITGKSGSGKTTLCEILSRRLKPQSGDIIFDKQNMNNLVDYEYFSKVHILKQNPHHNFIGLNPERDFLLWNDADKLESYYDLLKRYALFDKKDELLWKMSFGEQKCLFFIYLELIKRPLWILDEPLEGVDISRRELFLKACKTHIASGGSALISSHRVEQFEELSSQVINFEKHQLNREVEHEENN
ncbi:MAG: ATP-binding cassette domain-containing protein [Candidatus Cloacimonadales bacterium]|jgi:ABC-type multidrug transport system ATPase subunit|nr:ATP-binding cassette domain-containing protein [Candidatus Cloacimonadota bacterium]MDD2650387.1 ATP-binding cassette domain-containing protein [Candidatus Cloacimonadota bacterium]MDD3502023.1 ATP-binding cassette domain-containing protein [Candidatus Cloacimonadota bacterium]MDX9978181.1 ATP-binding cassette domain-containing protein [Candidatus Cloacimonadales bacterium]